MSGVKAAAAGKIADFHRRRDVAPRGGSDTARAKHLEPGKMPVRARLEKLVDGGVDFDDGMLAGAERVLPGDAVVTSIGKFATGTDRPLDPLRPPLGRSTGFVARSRAWRGSPRNHRNCIARRALLD